MYWFTSDQHFGHKNIIEYCNRPFNSTEEMDNEIIKRYNEVVGKNDIVIHAGDFSLIKNKERVYKKYINKLKGNHVFLMGSHDYWLNPSAKQIYVKNIDGIHIVVCHYAMRVWSRSHYNSVHLYGHSHGKLTSIGKSMDIGVDSNNFYPYPFDQIKEIMKNKPDNFNIVKKRY